MTHLALSLWRFGFLRALRQSGGPALSPKHLRDEQALHPKLRFRGSDAQAVFNSGLAFSLLCAVEIMERRHGLPRVEARRIAQSAFLQTGAGVTRGLTRLWLWTTRDPFGSLLRTTPLQRMRRLWGEGLDAHEEIGPNHVTLHVTGCAFAEFFWDAGRSDLAPILCAYDALWFSTINQNRRGLAVRREGTLTGGAPGCAFVFERRPAIAQQEAQDTQGRDPALGPGRL